MLGALGLPRSLQQLATSKVLESMLRAMLKNCLLLIAMAIVACGHSSPPPAPPPLNTSSTEPTEHLRFYCEQHGNVVAEGSASADVPVVVLYERSMRLSGFDVPTLLVYSDGTVVYGDEPYGESFRLYQATLSANSALEIQRATISRLRNAPAENSMSNELHRPIVQIIFRDDDAWRVVESYGMGRTTKESEVPAALSDLFAMYRELLNRRPSGRVPAPSRYHRPERWPDELPTFRGQHVVDQLAHPLARCSSDQPATGSTQARP
jgi:hypothetical protein